MGKINAKQKGARFERELADLFRKMGYAGARRTAQYCGNTGDASDVVGLPGIHVEAKHQETMRLYDWMEQAKRDSDGNSELPAVFHKKNRADILVTMTLGDWMQIYAVYEAATMADSDLMLGGKESAEYVAIKELQLNIDLPFGTTVSDETSEMAIKALEKQVAKKPSFEGDGYDHDGNLVYDTWICPCCEKHYEVDYEEYDYCPSCGQRIDWSEEQEGE